MNLSRNKTELLLSFAIRPLTESDIPRVAEIEHSAFPTFWPQTPFKRDFHNRRVGYLVSTRALGPEEIPERGSAPQPSNVQSLFSRLMTGIKSHFGHTYPIEDRPPDIPLGFVSIWFLTDEAHITAIAVEETWRGLGLGELLLIGAIENSIRRNSRVVTLEVRVSNDTAISLYGKYNFRRVGIRKGYYNDNREDAAIMTTDPIHSLSYRQKFSELREAYLQRHGSLEMTFGELAN